MKKFFYRVLKGDTALSVAKKFSFPVSRLIKINNLSREIAEGDLVYIESCTGRLYTVEATDTLSSVSEKFGVSEQKILTDNGVPYIFYGLTIIV